MTSLFAFILTVSIIYWKVSPILSIIEGKVISAQSGNVCELDNSCNITTTTAINDHQIVKSNASEKWRYNVSDMSSFNDTLHGFNETDSVVNFEIDSVIKNITEISQLHNETTPNQTTPRNTKYQITLQDDCRCDVTRGSCDLNCCCDRDCLLVNRDVFQYCIGEKSIMDKDECQSKILNSQMLCIVRDNLYSRHFYPKHETNSATSSFEKLMKNRQVYGWSLETLSHERTDPDFVSEFKEYQINSPIWIYTRDLQIRKFELPRSTLVSRDCDNVAPIKFLIDYEITCTNRVDNAILQSNCTRQNSFLNVGKYFTGFSFIRNPNSVNLSLPFNCSRHCIPLVPFICETDDVNTCRLANDGSSILKNVSCTTLVTSAHYKIVHNGIEGLVSVEVYLQLTNTKLRINLLWAVNLKITYEWVNQTKYYELSGYPGYEFGRPIIVASTVVTNRKNRENNTTDEIEMSHDSNRWFTYFDANVNGMCSKRRRNNVIFGENTYSHCQIAVPAIKAVEHCERFQNEIYNNMFGAHFNISTTYISILGEPNPKDKSKWIPITVDSKTINIANETCTGIVTSIKMVILYSLIGNHDNSQRSIVAVKATLNPLYGGLLKGDKLKIVFSVNFYDVTNPPMRIFAEPPTYEVKLPTDFFYPFFSNSARRLTILDVNVAWATIIYTVFGSV